MSSTERMESFIDGIELEDDAPTAAHTASVLMLDQDYAPVPVPRETTAPWSPRLTFDVALGEDVETLCARYELTEEQLSALNYSPAFRREVAEHQRQIREEGVTFRQKAKVQAEMYLEVLDGIVNSPDVSPATRLDAIKSVVKWGDLEPRVDKAASSGNVPQFNIQINL